MKKLGLCSALALSCVASLAHADISGGVVRVGVLNDISGIFQDTNGMGSVEAARMAAEDFGGGAKNIKVEIVYADHQNKADVGSAIARKWLEVDGVDAIVDVPNSAVGLTINSLLRDTKMTFLASSTASSDLTGKACSPNTIQWVNDVWATGNATAAAMMARGGKEWFFVTVNFALGQGIEAEATNYIEKHGGKVLGSAKHPLNTSDFASLLLQAQNSKAKVIGLANAGGDTVNAVKQAAEFGLQQSGQTMVAFLLFVNDVHGMGLKVGQGLQIPRSVLLGHGRRHPRLRQTLCGAAGHERQDAERQPGRRLCLHARLPQCGCGHRQRRCQGRRTADEKIQGQGQAVRRRHHPPGRPRHSPDVPVRGEEAGGVEISLRLLQADFDDFRRAGVPPAGGRRLLVGEVSALGKNTRHARACPGHPRS
jgi:hypothetical protein